MNDALQQLRSTVPYPFSKTLLNNVSFFLDRNSFDKEQRQILSQLIFLAGGFASIDFSLIHQFVLVTPPPFGQTPKLIAHIPKGGKTPIVVDVTWLLSSLSRNTVLSIQSFRLDGTKYFSPPNLHNPKDSLDSFPKMQVVQSQPPPFGRKRITSANHRQNLITVYLHLSSKLPIQIQGSPQLDCFQTSSFLPSFSPPIPQSNAFSSFLAPSPSPSPPIPSETMSEISFAYHETSLPPTESPSFMSSSQTFDAFMESMLNNSDPSQEPSRKNDSLTRENIQLVQYEPMSLKEQTLLALTNDETVINHLHTSEHDSIAPILPQKRQESTRLPEIQTKPLSSTQFYLHGFGAKKEKKLLKNFPNQGFKVSKFDPDNTTLSKTDIVIIEHGSMPENDYPCPAVSLFYVTECARMGSLVDPFSHILFRPTSFVPPLAGFNQFVFYLSGFTEINQRRMIGTIVHLLDARTEVEIIKCTYAIIATSDPLTQSNELSMIQTKNSGILCVKEEWITDCISSGSLLSISEYSLGS